MTSNRSQQPGIVRHFSLYQTPETIHRGGHRDRIIRIHRTRNLRARPAEIHLDLVPFEAQRHLNSNRAVGNAVVIKEIYKPIFAIRNRTSIARVTRSL